MADLQTTVDLIFRGVDNVSETTQKVAGSLSELSGAASSIAEPFADLAGKVAVVQTALLAVAGVIGTLAYKESVEFASSLGDLQKQMDDTEGSANEVAGALEDLAVKYGVNANELVKSAADFKASGNDLNTSTDLVKKSLDVMIAGEISAGEATDFLNGTLAGFGVKTNDAVKEADKLGDSINYIADISNGGFKQLSIGMKESADVAKLTGFNYNEFASILSVVIDRGKTGSEAATGLRSAFLSIVSPSKEAAETMEELGVSFDAAGKPMTGVKDSILAMIPAWEKLTDKQKLDTAATIAGKEQADKFIAVMNDWALITERTEKANINAGGTIDKEVIKKLALAESQINSTNEAWRQFIKSLGDQFQINTTGVIGSLGELATSMKQVVNSGGLDGLFDLLNPQLKSFEDGLRTIAQNLKEAFKSVNFSGLVEALKGLGAEGRKAIEALFGPMDLTTVEGLAKAIQNVVDVLTGLTNITAGELGGLGPFLSGIRQAVLAFKDLDGATKLDFGKMLVEMKLVSSAGASMGLALVAIGRAGLDMGAVMDMVFGAIRLAANGVQVAFDGIVLGLMSPIAAVAEGMIKLDDAVREFQGTANAPKSQMRNELDEIMIAFDAVKQNLLRNAEEGTEGLNQIEKGIERLADTSSSARIRLDETEKSIKAIGKESEQSSEEIRLLAKDISNIPEFKLPELQTGGILSKLDELAGHGDEVRKRFEQIVKANEGGYSISFDEKGIPQLTASVQTLQNGFNQLNGELKTTADGFKYVEETAENGQKTFRQLGPSFVDASKEATALEKAQKALGDAFGKSGADVVTITGALNQYMGALGASGKLTTDQFIELTKVTSDFKAKMEELASNERIKNLEFTAEIITTKLETDAKRVEATFASIDTAINSTGELLGNLFDNLTGTNNRWDKLRIEDQIDKENQRRQDALDLQKKLTEAEIDRIKAQTESLNRGDALIQVDGKGLAPELEAFMWKILSVIRVRANAEFGDYLLGLGVA